VNDVVSVQIRRISVFSGLSLIPEERILRDTPGPSRILRVSYGVAAYTITWVPIGVNALNSVAANIGIRMQPWLAG
jgi:hypothetical protein